MLCLTYTFYLYHFYLDFPLAIFICLAVTLWLTYLFLNDYFD